MMVLRPLALALLMCLGAFACAPGALALDFAKNPVEADNENAILASDASGKMPNHLGVFPRLLAVQIQVGLF